MAVSESKSARGKTSLYIPLDASSTRSPVVRIEPAQSTSNRETHGSVHRHRATQTCGPIEACAVGIWLQGHEIVDAIELIRQNQMIMAAPSRCAVMKHTLLTFGVAGCRPCAFPAVPAHPVPGLPPFLP